MVESLSRTFRSAEQQASGEQVAYLEAASAQESIYRGKLARACFLAAEPTARVLDVGCGIGDATLLIAKQLGGGTVVGLDQSEPLLAEARERTRAGGVTVEFVHGDAADMPFADDSFDAAQVERTLQHVPEPDAVVGEMVRVVRPRGTVLAVEPDWGTLVVDSSDREVAVAVATEVRTMMRHGDIGRRLRRVLRGAGLEDVVVDVESHVTDSLAVASYLALLGDAVGALRAAETFPAERLDAWLASLERDDEVGVFSAALSLFVARGTVPAG